MKNMFYDLYGVIVLEFLKDYFSWYTKLYILFEFMHELMFTDKLNLIQMKYVVYECIWLCSKIFFMETEIWEVIVKLCKT